MLGLRHYAFRQMLKSTAERYENVLVIEVLIHVEIIMIHIVTYMYMIYICIIDYTTSLLVLISTVMYCLIIM